MTVPFERNVLPQFANWLVDYARREEIDIVIPVETKGASLFEAALDYVRSGQTPPLRCQVLYRRALDFMGADALAGSRILLLDDAVRTGVTLNRLRKAVERCGDVHVVLGACIGLLPDDEIPERVTKDIKCFREVPDADYYTQRWQITDLVVSRGLPPEVDHHAFFMTSGLPLAHAWPQLLSRLCEFGTVDDHGAVSLDKSILGATLHWPKLTGHPLLPDEGSIRQEGATKLRFFADLATGDITVYPMAYARLSVPTHQVEDLAALHSLFTEWRGTFTRAAEPLLGAAVRPDSRLLALYHAITLTTDIELIKALSTMLVGAGLALPVMIPQPGLFERLYGSDLALRLESAISAELATNASEPTSGLVSVTPSPDRLREAEPTISHATALIVAFLRDEHLRRNAGRREADRERVGFSFGDLDELLVAKFGADDPLLLSRCLDFGLSLGSLVPYTLSEQIGTDTITKRLYRTSEPSNQPKNSIRDYESYQEVLAGQAAATVAYYMSRRSERYKQQPIPQLVFTKILTILEHALPNFGETALESIPQPHGPEMRIRSAPLIGPTERPRLIHIKSRYFHFKNGRIEPTEAFRRAYEDKSLLLDSKLTVPALESYLGNLVQVVDRVNDPEDLTTCWAISASGRLGLDYAMHDVWLALKELRVPVEVVLGGDGLRPDYLDRTRKKAEEFLTLARATKIEKLRSDWAVGIRAAWPEPIAAERDLLDSLCAPDPVEADLFFRLASAFCLSLHEVTALITSLPAADTGPQAALFAASDLDGRLELSSIFEGLQRAQLTMRTMRDPASFDGLGDSDDHLRRVAERADHVLIEARQMAAAFAWSFLHPLPRGGRLADPSPRIRVIMHADLAESTKRSLLAEHSANADWVNRGLNLMGQWGAAFGGVEFGDRRGDDIWLQFVDPDAAILCAALIQEHFAALRTTGAVRDYPFRVVLDAFWITDTDERNKSSSASNRAAKLAKMCAPGEIWMTPEACQECSKPIRECLLEREKFDFELPTERAIFAPSSLERRRLLELYIARLSAFAGKVGG